MCSDCFKSGDNSRGGGLAVEWFPRRWKTDGPVYTQKPGHYGNRACICRTRRGYKIRQNPAPGYGFNGITTTSTGNQ